MIRVESYVEGQCAVKSQSQTGARTLYFQANGEFGDPLTWSWSGNLPVPAMNPFTPNLVLTCSTILGTTNVYLTNGFWEGNWIAGAVGTNLLLAVDDGNGHRGLSSSFDVIRELDLAIAGKPDVAVVDGFLTNTISLSNNTLDGFTSLNVLDRLSDSLTLVSASASQGDCTLVGQRVQCNLGSLSAGASASIAIVTRPNAEGQATNLVTATCLGGDGHGIANSATLITTVFAPPKIVTQPAHQYVLTGTNLTLCIAVSGTPPFSYQWRKAGTSLTDGLRFAGATNQCLTVSNFLESDSDYYSVIVSNLYGVTVSSNFFLGNGSLDHFAWNSIASRQLVGAPFPVTITAQDVLGRVFSNFNGTVTLNAVSGEVKANSLLPVPGDNPLVVPFGDPIFTAGYAFIPHADLIVTHIRHFFGTKVSISTDEGTLLASQNVNSVPNTWVETPLATPIKLNAGATYRVACYAANWPGGSLRFYPTPPAPWADGEIIRNYWIPGDAFPSWELADFSVFSFLVDLRYNPGSVVSVTPTNTGNFVNGVWAGNVTVLEPGTNLTLRATDSTGRNGTCLPFDVRSLGLVMTPGVLNFGVVLTGATAQAWFVVTNAGTVDLNGELTGFNAPFAIHSATNFALGAGGVTNLLVQFGPTTQGTFSNAVVFTTDGLNSTNLILGRAVVPTTLRAGVVAGSTGSSGKGFSFAFDTIPGFNYVIEYKETLHSPTWLLLQSVPGDGTVRTVTNAPSDGIQRFYRLRME